MKTITLNVEGMSCGHCKASVESGLNNLNGVSTASVNLEAKTVTVSFDDNNIAEDALKDTIDDLGFDVV